MLQPRDHLKHSYHTVMRIGAAISAFFHITLVMAMLVFANSDAFQPTPAEAITVDIVPEKEAPKLDIPNFDFTKKESSQNAQDAQSKPPEAKPDVKPQDTKPAEQQAADKKQPDKAQQKAPDKPAPAQQAQQAPPQPQTPPPAPSAQQDVPPPAAQSAFDQLSPPQTGPVPYADLAQKFTSLTGADNAQFDAPATVTANVTLDAISALRQKIKECSVLPKSVSRDDAIEFVLRVALRRDGTITGEPDLFKIVKPTENGALLTVSAKKALLACQPYTMLPADKYNEWKTLDLSFTTRDFKGG